MSKLLDTIKARSVCRQQALLERWERERAKGKTRFVLQHTIAWATFMTAVRDACEQIFGNGHVSSVWFNLLCYWESLLRLAHGLSRKPNIKMPS